MVSTPALKFTDPYWRKPGVVYFIGVGSPPEAVKIGVATNERLFDRLRAIHGTNHLDPVLLGVVPFEGVEMPMFEAEKLERRLHQLFAAHQLRKAGTVGAEWFSPVPELMNYIRENAKQFGSLASFPRYDEIQEDYCTFADDDTGSTFGPN